MGGRIFAQAYQINTPAAYQPVSIVQGGAPDTYKVDVVNNSTTALSGSTFTVTLPAGMEYVAGTITGATQSNVSNLQKPVFTVVNIPSGNIQAVTFQARINCGYTQASTIGYSLASGATSLATGTSSVASNTPAPAFVLSSVPNPQVLSIQLKTDGTRTIKFKNSGVIPVTTVYVEGNVTTAAQIPSYKISSASNGIVSAVTSGQRVTLTGAELQNAITTSVGAPNASFDPGEEITIVLNEQILSCVTGSSIPLVISVGSGDIKGSFCFADSSTASISAITGDPAITLVRNSAATTWPDFCNVGKTSYTITNTGSASFGAASNMYKIKLPWSTFSTDATLVNTVEPASLRITKVSLNGTDVTSQVLKRNGTVAPYLISGVTTNCWVIDLSGLTQAYGTGLQDLDGDGHFDDLAVGKSAVLDFEYSWDLSNVQTCTLNSWGIPSDQNGRFNLGTSFQNQCGTTIIKKNYAANTKGADGATYPTFQVGYQNGLRTTSSLDVVALYPGDKTILNASIQGSLQGIFGQPNITVKTFTITLPDGLDYDPTGNLIYSSNSTYSPSYIIPSAVINYNAVTKVLTITPSNTQSGINGTNDFFKIPVIASNVTVVNKTVSTSATVGFTGCSTKASYGCGTVPINYAILSGNCPTVGTTAFGLTRATFGFAPVPGGSIWYQPTGFVNENTPNINLKGAVSKDKVKVSFNGRVNGTNFTELWARFKFIPTGTTPQTSNFIPLSTNSTDVIGTLTVTKASDGSTLSTDILAGDVQYNYIAAETLQVQQVNLSAKIGVGKAINYVLASGDTVAVNWLMRVSRDNLSYTYSPLGNLFGDLYTKDAGGTESSCEAIPDQFNVQRLTRSSNGYVGQANYYGNSSVLIQASIINYNNVLDVSGDHFPYETREYAHHRSITWTINGIWQPDTTSSPYISQNAVAVNYVLNWNMFTISYSGENTIVTFKDDAWGSNGMPSPTANIPVVSDFVGANGNFSVSFRMLAICKSTGPITANVVAVVDDFTTAEDNSNTESFTYNYTFGTSNYIYNTYAATATPSLQNVDGISSTVNWQVSVTNTTDKGAFQSGGANADLPNNWMSFVSPNTTIKVFF
ncbi:hypothetical protein GCM10022423_44830 [Flavobacterium ginsengiterrae]|uniref:Repeat protein (TIGR01451 family) n=2 Tax=Flavobacterium ginsengiterrae TaxID=871695 RepID=A0ABP7H5Z3_9FLAO